jgi:hypothetical protein
MMRLCCTIWTVAACAIATSVANNNTGGLNADLTTTISERLITLKAGDVLSHIVLAAITRAPRIAIPLSKADAAGAHRPPLDTTAVAVAATLGAVIRYTTVSNVTPNCARDAFHLVRSNVVSRIRDCSIVGVTVTTQRHLIHSFT